MICCLAGAFSRPLLPEVVDGGAEVVVGDGLRSWLAQAEPARMWPACKR